MAHHVRECGRGQKAVLSVSSVLYRISYVAYINLWNGSILGRRRKIRCTYTTENPNVCNECRLRGSKCIDQENHEDDRGMPPTSERGEQRYSLRERVAQLENVVQDLARRLDQQSAPVGSPSK